MKLLITFLLALVAFSAHAAEDCKETVDLAYSAHVLAPGGGGFDSTRPYIYVGPLWKKINFETKQEVARCVIDQITTGRALRFPLELRDSITGKAVGTIQYQKLTPL